ncbi:hypothetical protein WFK21_06460, partial [Yersinia enterocolitica]
LGAKIASVTSGHNVTCFDYEVMISPLFRWPNSLCHYIDYLIKMDNEQLLKENADGNLALSTPVISKFRKDSGVDVVWVKPDKYWRYRVAEDEDGREARG